MIFDREVMREFRTKYAKKQEERKDFRERGEINKGGSSHYLQFKHKLENELVSKFNNRDLVYYFREVSIEAGKKYCIASIIKDMAIMKRLRQTYSVEEIILMCDFLFSEDNDYLDNPTINILGSTWVNTIYTDSQAWADDTYIPHKLRGKAGKRSEQIKSREYSDVVSADDKIKIGEW